MIQKIFFNWDQPNLDLIASQPLDVINLINWSFGGFLANTVLLAFSLWQENFIQHTWPYLVYQILLVFWMLFIQPHILVTNAQNLINHNIPALNNFLKSHPREALDRQRALGIIENLDSPEILPAY